MEDNLLYLGTYKDGLPGTSYEAKLRSFFDYINVIHLHEDWEIPGERLEECNVILIAAEAVLEKESMVNAQAEAKVKFNEIRKRRGGSSKSIEDLIDYLS